MRDGVEEFCQRHEWGILCLGAAVAVMLRAGIAIFPHSGEGTPPMYGDFEAQRHWMEITTALPPMQWYRNSSDNDLLYWGLDYPPLTAYHSYVLGRGGHLIVPDCFKLHTSRGHESASCRLFMRASVILSDLVVYLPGAACAVWSFASKQETAAARVLALLTLWWLPPLLLIDHGHFQYNGVCFGLCLAAAGCVARRRILVGSVLFTSGLLFKQIALYYAPAFFFGILAHCLFGPPRGGGVFCAARRIAGAGIAVIATCLLLFVPWLIAPQALPEVLQVLHRMFPFARGLYEDKVANVWCSISVVIKLHRLMPQRLIPPFCAAATLAALLPANVCCLQPIRQSDQGTFAAALVASSMSFFLFAFQVHEKSILFACVAVCLLPIAMEPQRRPTWTAAAVCHFLIVCLFSMYPLVVKDSLQVVYAVLSVVLFVVCEACPSPVALRMAFRLSGALALAIHGVHALVPAPHRYPDLWTLMITGYSCVYFVFALGALTVAQLYGAFSADAKARKKD